MAHRTTAYEVILCRDEIADHIRRNLPSFRQVFLSLDHLAGVVRAEDDDLTEVVNSLADVLRGVLVERHGVDFRPTSDLGPDESIDLSHALRVLTQLVVELTQRRADRVLDSGNERLPDLSDSAPS
jgi:hypothetical protein